MTIASPDGASRPLTTLTAVTTPSIGRGQGGELDLGLQVVARRARVRELRPGVVDRDLGLADLRGDVGVLGVREAGLRHSELDPGGVDRGVRGGELALEVGRVGGREDVALLDGVADRDLEIGHGPGRGAGGRVGAGEVGRRPEGQAVGGARGHGARSRPRRRRRRRSSRRRSGTGVVAAALAGNPPTATNAAPTPTAANATMARIFSFIDVSRGRPLGSSAAGRALRFVIERRPSETAMRNRPAGTAPRRT